MPQTRHAFILGSTAFASIAMILLLAIPIVLRVRRALRMTEADRVLALPGG